MEITVKQISSLEKITSRNYAALNAMREVSATTVLRGERVSYQIALCAEDFRLHTRVWAESALGEVKLFRAADVAVDNPSESLVTDENFILNEPGILPDVLIPIVSPENRVYTYKNIAFVWVKVDVPENIKPGKYEITVHFGVEKDGDMSENFALAFSKTFTVEVVDAVMQKPSTVYTRWIYLDCISDAHNVEIFSEAHWELIDKYIAAAADVGINMLLVPVHTPPLDTEVGTARPCVQLVDIEKQGEKYVFGFDKFKRYVALCKKHGIKYYEIAHMFSQWGADFAPNIMVSEGGEKSYLFGWHVKADDERYVSFLRQYIAAIYAELESEGIAEYTYFHISDEPHVDQLEKYRTALNIFKPLIGKSKTFDALSHIEFYDEGLVECPVTSVRVIHEFLKRNIPNQWMYYCCHPERVFPNSFIAQPSARIRVLGLMLYKYNIKGFLHWGLNFYNAARSKYRINPYVTTSADGAFSSGDAFILYPGKNEVYGSTRAEVLNQAFEDIAVCETLEKKIGRDAVVKMIDDAAARDLRFDDYPCDNDFLENLRRDMVAKIAE